MRLFALLAGAFLASPALAAEPPAVGNTVEAPLQFRGGPAPQSTRKHKGYRVTEGTYGALPAYRIEWRDGRRARWMEVVKLPVIAGPLEAVMDACNRVPPARDWFQGTANGGMRVIAEAGIEKLIWPTSVSDTATYCIRPWAANED